MAATTLSSEDSALLKTWVTAKLAQISDADPDVLADYVVALVGTERPEAILDNLRDFLADKADGFVSELLQALAVKSYDPSRPAAQAYLPQRPFSLEPVQTQSESRKRSYNDWDAAPGVNGNGNFYQGTERPMKQPRRGGRGQEYRGGWQPQAPAPQHQWAPPPNMPPMPTPPPGMPSFNPNDPYGPLLAWQKTMGAFPGMLNAGSPTNANGFNRPLPRQRCRDYDTKGFCAAGASCPYDHGNDHMVIPSSNQEYDPNNATLLDITPNRIGQVDTFANARGRGGPRGRGRGRGGGHWRGGGKRSEISHAGPMYDESNVSIVVEQIPQDKCDEQSVREFFSEFGTIVEISMQAEKQLAIVKFDGHQAAQAAYDSPKVVFDNRFVKVYWYKPESKSNEPFRPHNIGQQESNMQSEDQIDLEQIAKKQEEAQRKHDEAKKKREEADKKQQDLKAQIKAMDEERKKMQEKLAKKTGGQAPSPPSSSPTVNVDVGGESQNTTSLKAELARLESEAKSLGIDLDAPTNGFHGGSVRGGGYRGRGRGRGFYPGYRGGWAGQGARGGAVMRLDNRSKTIAVTLAEGTYDEYDEAIRQFLLFNDLDSAVLEKHPEQENVALVKFNQRYEGENFMAATAAKGSQLPHVGKVELAWYVPNSKVSATNGDAQTAAAVAEAVQAVPKSEPALKDAMEDIQESMSDIKNAGAEDRAEEEDLDKWE